MWTAIVLAIILVLPAFGSGVPDKPNPQEYVKYSTVTVLSRLPLPEPEFGMVVQQLPMKPQFRLGEPFPVPGSKPVYPLLNLDVFLVVKGKPTQLMAKKSEDSDLAVVVVIPEIYVKRITHNILDRITDIFFWDEHSKQWIPFDEFVKNGEVSPLVAGPGFVSFEIYRWPLGDRMIGCW
ncbi:MAG: hypothetical protein A2177_09910 [Spirochaetes bacterium RBG_13_68_11]|nr:MAG: hypothetical protein A2177_09910 [Spirochaetes bacterium RBG_13_68_11]